MNFRNPKFTPVGAIDCEIEHPELGWVPFTCDPDEVGSSLDVSSLYQEMEPLAVPYTPPPVDEVLIQWREEVSIPKGEFCMRLVPLGILSRVEALNAARSEWPTPMDSFLEVLTEDQAMEVQIAWATETTIHRNNVFVLSLASWLNLSDEVVDTLFN